MYREQLEAYFQDKQDMLVDAVCRLVSIDSVEGEPAPGAPFGPGPAAALEEGLKLAQEWGLITQNHEGYVGTADLCDKEDALHILGHLDVVAPGEGWTVTQPYQPKVVDGLIYGRGTDDDKGPVVASLLAMKAVKDLGVPLKSNCRLIMGTNEESGSGDIAWYFARHPFARDITARTGITFTCTSQDGCTVIHAKGEGSHAAWPEGGNNAVTGLIALLCALPLAEGPCKEALNQLNTLLPHGDYHGRALGIAQSEPIAGDLTVAFTLLEVTETGLTGRFDSRVPLCATKENCENVARAAFEAHGFTFEGEQEEAHHTPADSPFVQTLLKRYEEYTGQKGECLSTGGGTYVHEIPGGVAFGCTMPGFDTHLHGADERVKIADLMLSAKLFAHIILDMCAE
ncbi:M20 family peptidase [Pseudoflavonifractor sp. SW1122]|uniref:M20/M25/M40 family metallo-hydrolase n=1 Tax=Pseudoflavonifractor sp. SW1122 TaxID=2530044 RepID=UPI00143C7CBF|nr:M20/M25/M40 family metallo-hydrolase [Pseudoflavonifractor sp. SW1122]NJE73860.1 M20 family peptidase [Pseudoflavonifractor sp. SW1122]